MSAANSGIIVGTIVSDIISRKPTENMEVVSLRVSPVDSGDNDSPIPLTAYNGVGQNLKSRFNKGDVMSFSYRLRYNTWMSQEGEPRGRMEVVVTSSTTIRLGKLSTAQRAAAAMESARREQEVEDAQPVTVAASSSIREDAQPVTVAAAEPTLEEIPF